MSSSKIGALIQCNESNRRKQLMKNIQCKTIADNYS
jgi:hypothetical protein